MSKTIKVLNALKNGEQLTARQITSRFNVANPYDIIYNLRHDGYAIYLNEHTNSKGEVTQKYRLGAPTRAIIAAGIASLGSESVGPNARKMAFA